MNERHSGELHRAWPSGALLTAAILSILGLAVVLARKSRPADQT